MSKPVSGSDGPASPRYPSQGEGVGKPGLTDALPQLRSKAKEGPEAVSVRQGDGRDVPLDGAKTRKRLDDCATAMAEPKGKAAGLWSEFKAGLRGFAEMLGLIAPKRVLPDVTMGSAGMVALRENIAAFRDNPAAFLRMDNAFSSQMRDDLLARTNDGKITRDLMGAMQQVRGAPPRGLDYELASMGPEASRHTAQVTQALLGQVFGGDGRMGLAERLPESWLTGLREAGDEILRSDLQPQDKTDAIRTLVKSTVFLRFVNSELVKGTLSEGAHPGLAAANKCLLKLVNGAPLDTLSPELRGQMSPLAERFAQQLDGFVVQLGMPRVGG